MADEEVAEEGAEDSSGGKKKLIIIIVAVVILLAGGGTAAFFLLGSDESGAATEEVAEEAPVELSEKAIYTKLHPAFVTNFQEPGKYSIMQTEVFVRTYNVDTAEAIKKHDASLRSELLYLFAEQSSDDLAGLDGKKKLNEDALQVVNEILEERGAKGDAEAVVFTSFILQ